MGDLDEVCDRLIVLAPARVQLDAEMSWARAHHRLVPLADAAGMDIVGSFANRRGVHTALVRTEDPVADPPGLDDIVLGYLAAGPSTGGRRHERPFPSGLRLQRFEIVASLAAGLVLAGSALVVWFRLTGLHVEAGCFHYVAGPVPLSPCTLGAGRDAALAASTSSTARTRTP